ncbi:hypothetical protein VHEMI05592 [[Torrubiella] hemipterigena]|uniref:tRNA (adenine(58)-N(1))-methyltransferase catalytic subunit TRM61 n=1 Tax=[Torrubiella] hemipterigena TaxID=1531966 RepID=A0A0A1TJ52_9HYPO|nr:hypothetical protein VHEMI05592 [[Torrubiella] hemipterigena]
MASEISSFLLPGDRSKAGQLAIVSLARDDFAAINLDNSTGAVDGYAEGAVLNTRFGSFPHSTLLNVPWGSQVRASTVDTGSRGRKRRLDATDDDTPAASQDEIEKSDKQAPAKKAVVASSGFVYLLRPSPELWTSSLPHRTQVVYTPDYSYVLQRIQARPGTRIIEAGAGSGSFTHASVRAVWNGNPVSDEDVKGKVFSFEYDEIRYHKMKEEIKEHSLNSMVHITHRDVYRDGFNVDGKSPKATAIFLDLPAPWKALHHLSRQRVTADEQSGSDDGREWVSPLDPNQSVHICTFSPCIEQVSRTVTELRKLGWINVSMVEISNKKFNVSRERVGIDLPNDRGNTQSPADVTEAIAKLQKVSKRSQEFHKLQAQQNAKNGVSSEMEIDTPETTSKNPSPPRELEKQWLSGKLVTRPEADLKTHTSYLVFAVLPREWSEEQEAAALAKWPCGEEKGTIGNVTKAARKEEKRRLLQPKKRRTEGNDTQ